jgi:hypothetical protein
MFDFVSGERSVYRYSSFLVVGMRRVRSASRLLLLSSASLRKRRESRVARSSSAVITCACPFCTCLEGMGIVGKGAMVRASQASSGALCTFTAVSALDATAADRGAALLRLSGATAALAPVCKFERYLVSLPRVVDSSRREATYPSPQQEV